MEKKLNELEFSGQKYYNDTNIFDKYYKIIDRLYKIYVDKNHDYGNSFDETCDEFGLIAPVIRMNDKIKRCKSVLKNNDFKVNESLEDTISDLTNYCVMTLMWIEKNSKK